jgi:hypothetical protein
MTSNLKVFVRFQTHTILINIGEQRKSGELNTDLNSGKDDDRSYLEATSDETTRKGERLIRLKFIPKVSAKFI